MNRQQRRAASKQGGIVRPGVSSAAQGAFTEARRYHQAGRLQEAERLYRQVLIADPHHADSLHLLGLIGLQLGRNDIAADLIRQALSIDAAIPLYHFHFAMALHNLGRLDEADIEYRRAIALKPNYPEAHNNLGNILKDRGRPDDAAASYRRVIALMPQLAEPHYNLGVVLHSQGKFDEAADFYRMAVALEATNPDAYYNLGITLKDQGKAEEAEDCFRKVIAFRPDHPDAYENLANVLRNQGRFDEARIAYEAALQFGGDPGISYHGLSVGRKFKPADRPLIADMQAAQNSPKLSDANRSLLQFALGKAFDDLGEYEAAMRHFDEGNRLEHALRRFDGASGTALVDWLIASFPKESLAPPVISESERPILIVGMPRSGTTLVEQILASHPDVAAGGELGFWLERSDRIRSRKISGLEPTAERQAIRDYLGLLERISPAVRRVTDKMPFNFLVLGLIHRLLPKARIIHCRRNPIDTALSVYFTRFVAPHDFAYSRSDIVQYYRQYLRLMAHWREALPPDQFLEIDYEDLIANQEEVSRRMVAFSGLDWNEACLRFHDTVRPIRTASVWQARQPVYRSSTERWKHYEPWLGELSELRDERD